MVDFYHMSNHDQVNGNGIDPQVSVTTSHDQASLGEVTLNAAGRFVLKPNIYLADG